MTSKIWRLKHDKSIRLTIMFQDEKIWYPVIQNICNNLLFLHVSTYLPLSMTMIRNFIHLSLENRSILKKHLINKKETLVYQKLINI